MSFWWRSTRGLTCRYMDKTKKKKRNFFISLRTECSLLAWKNSRHFTTLPLVFPPKDVWEEILYWWRDTTQIWVVLLINWKFASTNQKHYPDLGSVTSQVLDVCARFSDVISRENQRWCREKTAVFFRLVLCGLFDTFLLFLIILSSLSCWLFAIFLNRWRQCSQTWTANGQRFKRWRAQSSR